MSEENQETQENKTPVFYCYYCRGAIMKSELKRRADRKLNGKLLGTPEFATVYSTTGVVDGTYRTMDQARAQCMHSDGLAIFIRGNKPLTAKQYNARLRAEQKDAEKRMMRYV